ncbi:uncharacterized protein [Diadema antillarum]|uniref:uncharacterized protein n=1 Tax=Diadema antillarum TaxID=105358 RepID=UPI003A86C57D
MQTISPTEDCVKPATITWKEPIEVASPLRAGNSSTNASSTPPLPPAGPAGDHCGTGNGSPTYNNNAPLQSLSPIQQQVAGRTHNGHQLYGQSGLDSSRQTGVPDDVMVMPAIDSKPQTASPTTLRKTIRSRARPRRPEEPAPFLSVDTLPADKIVLEAKSHATTKQQPKKTKNVSKRISPDFMSPSIGKRSQTPTNPPFSPYGGKSTPRSPSRAGSSVHNYNSFFTHKNSAFLAGPPSLWSLGNRFWPHQATPSEGRRRLAPLQPSMALDSSAFKANVHVSQPFKHDVNASISMERPVSPSQEMRESTLVALQDVSRALARQQDHPVSRKGGRLLKGKLKPLHTFQLEGPRVEDCQGILTEDKRRQTPNKARLIQRKRELLSMLPPDVFQGTGPDPGPVRPETQESVHRTSIVSALSLDREYSILTPSMQHGPLSNGHLVSQSMVEGTVPQGPFNSVVTMADDTPAASQTSIGGQGDIPLLVGTDGCDGETNLKNEAHGVDAVKPQNSERLSPRGDSERISDAVSEASMGDYLSEGGRAEILCNMVSRVKKSSQSSAKSETQLIDRDDEPSDATEMEELNDVFPLDTSHQNGVNTGHTGDSEYRNDAQDNYDSNKNAIQGDNMGNSGSDLEKPSSPANSNTERVPLTTPEQRERHISGNDSVQCNSVQREIVEQTDTSMQVSGEDSASAIDVEPREQSGKLTRYSAMEDLQSIQAISDAPEWHHFPDQSKLDHQRNLESERCNESLSLERISPVSGRIEATDDTAHKTVSAVNTNANGSWQTAHDTAVEAGTVPFVTESSDQKTCAQLKDNDSQIAESVTLTDRGRIEVTAAECQDVNSPNNLEADSHALGVSTGESIFAEGNSELNGDTNNKNTEEPLRDESGSVPNSDENVCSDKSGIHEPESEQMDSDPPCHDGCTVLPEQSTGSPVLVTTDNQVGVTSNKSAQASPEMKSESDVVKTAKEETNVHGNGTSDIETIHREPQSQDDITGGTGLENTHTHIDHEDDGQESRQEGDKKELEMAETETDDGEGKESGKSHRKDDDGDGSGNSGQGDNSDGGSGNGASGGGNGGTGGSSGSGPSGGSGSGGGAGEGDGDGHRDDGGSGRGKSADGNNPDKEADEEVDITEEADETQEMCFKSLEQLLAEIASTASSRTQELESYDDIPEVDGPVLFCGICGLDEDSCVCPNSSLLRLLHEDDLPMNRLELDDDFLEDNTHQQKIVLEYKLQLGDLQPGCYSEDLVSPRQVSTPARTPGEQNTGGGSSCDYGNMMLATGVSITPSQRPASSKNRPKSGLSSRLARQSQGMSKPPKAEENLERVDVVSDSGCGSEMSEAVTLGSEQFSDEEDVHHDLDCSNTIESDSSQQQCDDLQMKPKENYESDAENLKIVARTKPRHAKHNVEAPLAPFPPLCFKINARPPPGKLYYFAYGPTMNPARLSMYIGSAIDQRLWGILHGFAICFNKKGQDREAGGFANIRFSPESSVEGCVYCLTPVQLESLDQFVGCPEFYTKIVLPVWMLNCTDPNKMGVAQYCIPAVMYIAQDRWTHFDDAEPLSSAYSVQQSLKGGDLLSPAYRHHLETLVC